MKRTFFFLFASIIAFVARAQVNDDEILPSDRNHLTAVVSFDVSIPGKWIAPSGSVKMFKPGSGVSVGADYMWLLGKNFFFEPGARLFFDTYKYNDIVINAGSGNYEGATTFDPPVRKTGLRIPLTAGYKFDVFKSGSLFLSTGPEPILGFTAKTKLDSEDKEFLEEDMYKSMMRRYDVAWDIRVAIIIDRFRVDLTGAFGMLDVMKTNLKMHEYRVSLGLGYVF